MSTRKKLFAFVVLPLVLAFGGLAIYATRSVKNESQSSNSQSDTKTSTGTDTEPVLKNLGGVTLADYNATTGLAGDIKFAKDDLSVSAGIEASVFLFGQNLPRQNASEPQRINPNFEFGGLSKPINVVAAIDGIVAFVKQQPDSNDYEVFLSTAENSKWVIGYDHLTGLALKQGDRVTAGQKLGQAAQYKNSYRYELQINNEGDGTMHCPINLLDTPVREAYAEALNQLTKDWNQWYGKAIYPVHDGGCIHPYVTAAQSEGG